MRIKEFIENLRSVTADYQRKLKDIKEITVHEERRRQTFNLMHSIAGTKAVLMTIYKYSEIRRYFEELGCITNQCYTVLDNG